MALSVLKVQIYFFAKVHVRNFADIDDKNKNIFKCGEKSERASKTLKTLNTLTSSSHHLRGKNYNMYMYNVWWNNKMHIYVCTAQRIGQWATLYLLLTSSPWRLTQWRHLHIRSLASYQCTTCNTPHRIGLNGFPYWQPSGSCDRPHKKWTTNYGFYNNVCKHTYICVHLFRSWHVHTPNSSPTTKLVQFMNQGHCFIPSLFGHK